MHVPVDAVVPGTQGIYGPNGFIAYPGPVQTGQNFDEWCAWIKANVFPALARDEARAGEVAQKQPTPYGQSTGAFNGVGIAEQLRAPGKQFSRSDILAILRAEGARQKANGIHEAALLANDTLIRIFESIE